MTTYNTAHKRGDLHTERLRQEYRHTHTLIIFNTYFLCLLEWLRESTTMLLYKYIDYIIQISLNMMPNYDSLHFVYCNYKYVIIFTSLINYFNYTYTEFSSITSR